MRPGRDSARRARSVQLNGAPVVLASYDQETGNWTTNPNCFGCGISEGSQCEKLCGNERGVDGSQNRLDPGGAIFGSFSSIRSDAMAAMMEREPLAKQSSRSHSDELQRRGFVGHKYGPDSEELRVTLGEMDRQLKRILSALEAKVGNDYLLAVTATMACPRNHFSPDRRTLHHRS